MPKVVQVRHKTVGLCNQFLRLSIFCYFVVFVMWWNKGYQTFDFPLSGVSIHVNGIATVYDKNGRLMILDSPEYLLQPLQRSGVFIITRLNEFTVQHLDECHEARDLEDAYCHEDKHCKAGYTAGGTIRSPAGYLPTHWVIDDEADGHGVFTGRCDKEYSACEIYGWCPVQEDLDSLHAGLYRSSKSDIPWNSPEEQDLAIIGLLRQKQRLGQKKDITLPMDDVLNFTLFIKNAIEFPNFDIGWQNILPWMDAEYLRTCIYNREDKKDRYCPNFRIGDIIEMSGGNKYRLLRHGGEVAITINWECNLDFPLNFCLPTYNFVHLDELNSDEDDERGPGEGWPMEFAKYFGNYKTVRTKRLLSKVNAIQFMVVTTGRAGRFSLFEFTMQAGSNYALFSLASFICDLILFNCTRDRELYDKAAHHPLDNSLKSISMIAAPYMILDSIRRSTEKRLTRSSNSAETETGDR
ncbi:unnamed protein product [Calicophoron daubneyi]|uniref:P2X purinoceptor 4 n=1 Tax=Calicophoron daubneyi TaxID=300641 RepID=A0AAV2U0X7_CALDB